MRWQISMPEQYNAKIYSYLLHVIQKWPSHTDLFLNEFNLFMALSSDVYRQHRFPRKLTRIICSLALLRSKAREMHDPSLKRPRIHFCLIPMMLKFTFGEKPTMGVCIGIGHLSTYQLFNEGSILKAIRMHYPDVQTVKGSFLSLRHQQDTSHVFYIELEQKNGKPFTHHELSHLKKHLNRSLEASIEDVVPSLFMMSNEEEIIKNIIVLRDEIQSAGTLPQVMITFESQTLTHTTFIVILVKVQEKRLFQNHFIDLDEEWEYIPDRTMVVSPERDPLRKEAQVFRLCLKKSSAFVRTDSSVNLHRARQYVVDFLEKKIGPFRDYTGSLIHIQNTFFGKFYEKYRSLAHKYPNLLEDFFYTITPADAQIALPFSAIETLFNHFMALDDTVQDTPEKYRHQKK